MEFRTPVKIETSTQNISHQHSLLLIGSCFTENIGERLQSAGFRTEINPFGIQYNPLSVETSLLRLSNREIYNSSEIFEHEGNWHSFGHHSRFSAATKEDCLQKINERMAIAANALRDIDFLFITFGTAWVYLLQETGQVVSNCHKLPEKYFLRHRLSVEEITEHYDVLLPLLRKNNPKLQVIFTVSPIRHWKDGAHGNNLSKATLQLAIEHLQQKHDFVSYFPAYEIMLDELRDYRFYADDMQHPSQKAIDYIWQRFADCYFSLETKKNVAMIEKKNRQSAHRRLLVGLNLSNPQ